VTIIRPETLVRWHRAGFRHYWRWKSRSLGGRPQIDADLRALIRRMSIANAQEYFGEVYCSDAYDYGFGEVRDFLTFPYEINAVDWIIESPLGWFVWEKNLAGTSRLMWIPPCRKQLERPGDYDLLDSGDDLSQRNARC
jgi:hypothetical protein